MAITAMRLHIGHRSQHPNPVVSLSVRDIIEHLLTLPDQTVFKDNSSGRLADELGLRNTLGPE
jgi:hypothetical protein